MAILVHLFHLLTILLFTQVLLCSSKTDPQCNKPFHCGNIESLSYPFRQRGSPEYCGEPRVELSCEADNNPIITINSQTYQVLAFNISLHSLTVAPINISTNLLCPQQQPLNNISLNLTPFHSAWNTQNVTLYHDCPANANQSLGLSNHQFDCTMNETHSTVGYYVFTSGFYKISNEAKDALRSCRSSVLVPAFTSTLQALEKNPSSANLVLTLSNGFGLTWKGNDSLSDGLISNIKLTIGLAVAGAVVLAITVMVVTFMLKKDLLSKAMLMKKLRGGRSKDWEMIEDFILQYGSELAPKRYTYSDIKRITKSFKDELGQGGFGSVYKGQLPDSRLVAVKILSESKARGEDFVNEVASISRTSHVNIVAFLGFCFEGSIRALIYEFMPNGSLDKFICHPSSPDRFHHLELKTTLYEIALGIARGLEYLHQGCSTRILHFDIKPHNILLDDNFCPKISDFGLAKLCERKDSIVSTISARGTIGYIAPEVFCRSFGGVSHKSDVYSYGMMILEMVGQKGDVYSQNSRIYELLKEGMDLDLEEIGVENDELNRKMIIVSLWCIQSNPTDRPSMTKVLEMLQGSIDSLPIPPTPFLFSTPIIPEISSSSTLLFTQSSYMDNNV